MNFVLMLVAFFGMLTLFSCSDTANVVQEDMQIQESVLSDGTSLANPTYADVFTDTLNEHYSVDLTYNFTDVGNNCAKYDSRLFGGKICHVGNGNCIIEEEAIGIQPVNYTVLFTDALNDYYRLRDHLFEFNFLSETCAVYNDTAGRRGKICYINDQCIIEDEAIGI